MENEEKNGRKKGKKGEKQEKKMGKIVDFVLEKIKEGYCIILGGDDLIDHFSDSFKIDINIMMMDYKEDEQIKSVTLRLFNNRTKEITTVGMVKRIDLMPILKMGSEMKGVKVDNFDDIIGIELEKDERRKGIYPIIAKTDKDKKNFIDNLFKIPEEQEIKMVEEIIKEKKLKNEDEYKGYA